MEAHHFRLVFRTDRANRERRAVAGGPFFNPCRRIGTDARPWQIAIGNRPIVKQCAGVKGEKSRGRAQQRIYVDFLDARSLRDKLTEADENLFESGAVDGRASPDAAERFVYAGTLHHPASERRGQRRQSERVVAEDFHELPSEAKQKHWAELRIDAR